MESLSVPWFPRDESGFHNTRVFSQDVCGYCAEHHRERIVPQAEESARLSPVVVAAEDPS